MMQAKKAFICGFLVATGLCLGGRALKEPFSHWTNPHVYTMPDGTIVETIRPEPSEIAEALELKRWHFRATLPKGSDADMFRYGIEVRKNGIPSPKGDEFFVPDGQTIDVTVCLSAQNSDWLKSPDIKVWISSNFPKKYEGHISSSYRFPNPFIDYKGSLGTADDGDMQKDGTFALVSTHKPLNVGRRTPPYKDEPYPVSIVFKIKAVNQRKELQLTGESQSPVKPLSPSWEAWFR